MKRIAMMLVLGSFLWVGYAPAQVYEFSKPNVPVNDDSLGRNQHYPTSAGMHCLVARGDTLYATWYDNRDGNNKIYFSKSTNGGVSWSPNVIVNDTATASHFWSAIAVNSVGDIYICWKDDRETIGVRERIYCAKSTDGGVSWGTNVVANQSFRRGGLQSSIWTDRTGRVFIGWGGGDGFDCKPYLSKSTDGGQLFETALIADSFYVDPGYPSIGVDDSGLVYITFASPRPGGGAVFIWFTKAVDSADTSFLPPMIVSDTADYREKPSLVTKPNGDTYIAYRSINVPWVDIYLVKSTDRGRTFGPPVRVSDVRPPGYVARDPSIAVDTGRGVYVAWFDNRLGGWHGYFAASTNGGDSFGPSVLIEDTSGSPNASRYWQNLAIDPQTGTAYVIWSDERNNPGAAMDIYSARGVLRSGVEERAERLAALNEVRLEAIYPNPMRDKATVRYAMPASVNICLAVFNVAGQRVCTLREGVVTAAGKHEVEWDGRDQYGKEVRSGIYFISFESKDMQQQEEKRIVQKVVKLQ